MMDDGPVTSDDVAGGNAQTNTLATFLALYLLILAFFILLVSISTPEDIRSKVVMSSLNASFNTVLPPSVEIAAFASDEGDVLAGQAFQERITGILATTLQVAKVEIVQPGRLMRAFVPTNALFVPGEAQIRESRGPFLDRIVAALSTPAPGVRHDVELVMSSPLSTEAGLPVRQTLAAARAGAFARDMVARGAPPDAVAVGLRAGHPGEVVLRFFIRNREDGGSALVKP